MTKPCPGRPYQAWESNVSYVQVLINVILKVNGELLFSASEFASVKGLSYLPASSVLVGRMGEREADRLGMVVRSLTLEVVSVSSYSECGKWPMDDFCSTRLKKQRLTALFTQCWSDP